MGLIVAQEQACKTIQMLSHMVINAKPFPMVPLISIDQLNFQNDKHHGKK